MDKNVCSRDLLDAKEVSIAKGEGPMPSIAAISVKCGVGWHFVKKIEGGLLTAGHVVASEEIHRQRRLPTGPGSICMD